MLQDQASLLLPRAGVESQAKYEARTVVLGAGPAGISAAIAIGSEAIVLEAAKRIGGLSGTVELDGAVFDVGGHSFHTPHPKVRELIFDSLDMYEQTRQAYCYSYRSTIPYPFQKHFHELPDKGVVAECEEGRLAADGGAAAANFQEYLSRRFGPGICRHFLFPYNRKLWGPDLRRLSADWVAERIAGPADSTEKFESNGGQRKPLQDGTVVAYPARGGFGEIVQALARKVERIRLDTRVVRIDPDRKELTTQHGETYRWQQLISTIPLNELMVMLEGVPASLREDARCLEYLSLQLVFAVIDHPVDTEIQRMYSGEPHIPAHKIAINHASSPYLRSLPRSGISGEISCHPDKSLPRQDIERWFVESLLEMRLIREPGEVVRTATMFVKYGYPVPTHDRKVKVQALKRWLGERDIFSIGRFGEWSYMNSDEAIQTGLSLGSVLAARS